MFATRRKIFCSISWKHEKQVEWASDLQTSHYWFYNIIETSWKRQDFLIVGQSISWIWRSLKSYTCESRTSTLYKCMCNHLARGNQKKGMNVNTKTDISKARVCPSNSKRFKDKRNKGRRSDFKCNYCNNLGHSTDHCWVLHPNLKPKFARDNKAD